MNGNQETEKQKILDGLQKRSMRDNKCKAVQITVFLDGRGNIQGKTSFKVVTLSPNTFYEKMAELLF